MVFYVMFRFVIVLFCFFVKFLNDIYSNAVYASCRFVHMAFALLGYLFVRTMSLLPLLLLYQHFAPWWGLILPRGED